MLGHRDGRAQDALDALHVLALVRRGQRDGVAFLAGAAGAADAVHVVIGLVGQVVVDDHLDAADVDAAGGDVGGDHHANGARLEPGQRGLALVERAVGVDLGHAVAGVQDDLGHPVGGAARAHEDQHRALVFLQQRREQLGLVVALHDEQLLRHLFRGRAGRGDFGPHRHAHVVRRDLDDVGGHGGREQHGLAFARHQAKHVFDLGQEAHVEHAVGLVQHQHLHAVQPNRSLLQVVVEAARGGDQDAGLLLEAAQLVVHGLAADQHHGAHAERRAQAGQRLIHLQGQLARGSCRNRRPTRRPHAMVARGAHFGLFVHWGLYSGLAGTWDGKAVATQGRHGVDPART
jgi:hypothetical protein